MPAQSIQMGRQRTEMQPQMFGYQNSYYPPQYMMNMNYGRMMGGSGGGGYFMCTYCQQPLNEDQIKSHVSEHLGYEVYSCSICQEQFVSLHDCQEHARLKHRGSRVKVMKKRDASKEAAVTAAVEAIRGGAGLYPGQLALPSTETPSVPTPPSPSVFGTPDSSAQAVEEDDDIQIISLPTPTQTAPRPKPKILRVKQEPVEAPMVEMPLVLEEEEAEESNLAPPPTKRLKGPSDDNEIKCAKCGQLFKNSKHSKEVLHRHIAKDHLNKARVKCKHCDFTEWWTAAFIRKHNVVHHPDEDLEEFLDRKEEMRLDMDKEMQSCFNLRYGGLRTVRPGRREKRKEKLLPNCSLCAWKTVSKDDERTYHIIVAHPERLQEGLRCKMCNKGTFDLKGMKEHFAKSHRKAQLSYEDRRTEEREKLHRVCFVTGA